MATTEEDLLRGQISDLEGEVASLQTQLEAEQARVGELIDVIAAGETEVDAAIADLQTASRNLYNART